MLVLAPSWWSDAFKARVREWHATKKAGKKQRGGGNPPKRENAIWGLRTPLFQKGRRWGKMGDEAGGGAKLSSLGCSI